MMIQRRSLKFKSVRYFSKREPKTALANQLETTIKFSGQVTMDQFVRQCLLHPIHGYYMTQDVFGTKGDFTTNPEISQIFGELIGLWYVNQNMQTNKKFNLVELGPGRGTLMKDVLQTLKSFPEVYKRLEKVYMVDQSPFLKQMQKDKLKEFDLEIEWRDRIQDIEVAHSYYLAHEFYDALPCYQFKMTDKGFREIMVDINDHFQTPNPFKTPDLETTQDKTLIRVTTQMKDPIINDKLHFRKVVSTQKTKSLLLFLQQPEYNTANIDDIVQISPDSWDITCYISKNIKNHGGAFLIADYGYKDIRKNTLRGIKDHRFVDPLTEPGHVDLSFDVEFSSIGRAARKEGVFFHGPVEQGRFLQRMGIEERMRVLLSALKTKQERDDCFKGVQRLVGPEEMGKIYKLAAITDSKEIPYGFE
jgi:NADH dehydrogenase [ubiquinone] 1 alpha subcomplex assembly factor 7